MTDIILRAFLVTSKSVFTIASTKFDEQRGF